MRENDEKRQLTPTAKTIIWEYERAFEPAICLAQGSYGDVNTSSILTRLIQETGRFAERFASDLFIDWERVQNIIGCGNWEKPETGEVHHIAFGIREDGVDGNAYLIRRLLETEHPEPFPSDRIPVRPKQVYRRIFVLKITINGDYINMGLKDLTRGFRTVWATDKEGVQNGEL